MSINNATAISDALKYINGMPVIEEKSSITSDIKASVCSPLNGIFGAMQVKDSLMDTFEIKKIKELPQVLSGLGEVQPGEYVNGKALRSTKLTDQFKAAADKFINKADLKAAQKAAKKAGAATTELAVSTGETAATTTELATVGAEGAAKTGKGIFSKIGSAIKGVGNGIKSVFSKAGSAIAKTGPGKAITKALGKFANTGAGKLLAKGGKILKGTGAVGMMVFDGIFSLFTEVIPAFSQGGAKAGVKQIGKSAVKVAGTGLGWAGGTMAATAIGAAIGSIFPGVGTVIGGAIGQFVGGFVGSAIGGGVAKKITGKSETEKLQEQQYQQAAEQIANSPEAMNELNQQVIAKVQSDIENGTANDDTEKIAEYINSGAFNTYNNPNNAANPNQYPTTGQQPANGMNYWAEMARRAAQGDTSIYNISDERLASVFNSPANTSSSTQTSEQEEKVVNYFG